MYTAKLKRTGQYMAKSIHPASHKASQLMQEAPGKEKPDRCVPGGCAQMFVFRGAGNSRNLVH